MNARSFGEKESPRLRPLRAARAIVFALVSTVLLLAGAMAPKPAAAGNCGGYPPQDCYVVLPDPLPAGAMGDSYSQQLYVDYVEHGSCSCMYSPVGYWLDNGSPPLPTGLTLTVDGLLSGTLAAPGTYNFRLMTWENCEQDYACLSMTVTGTNHQPTFTAGGDVTVLQDDPPYGAIWATDLSKGGPADVGQTLVFHVSNDNNALFSVQPAIAADGTLSFTLAPDANGVATVSVYLEDNGGIANGGINHSFTVTFQIDVTPYDQPQKGPTFTVSSTDWTTDHACTKHSCTLREAIEAANNYGGNNAAGPASTIELAPGAVYTIDGVDNPSEDTSPNGLPQITSTITINGHGAHIARSDTAPATRLIDVGGGFLTLNEIALENGMAGPSIYSSSAGGAILVQGQLVIKNSYLANNSAGHGGAIYNPGGPVAWIYNSTFYANSADDGAIYSYGSLDLYNNTFVDNIGVTESVISLGWTSNTKYNFYNNLLLSSDSSVPLCNIDVPSTIITVGANLATDSSCPGFGATTYDAIQAVTPPDYNGGLTENIAIQAGSSAIDGGNASACQNVKIAGRDQRGKPRFVDGNGDGVAQCDVGAFEYGAAEQSPPCIGDCNGDRQVTITDLVVTVNIALGTEQVSMCLLGDANGDGEITIDEIIRAVNVALSGCTDPAAACVASGGQVTEVECYCTETPDFFDTCGLGACSCPPTGEPRQLNSCDCGSGRCWNGGACVLPVGP
jgi:CSLREA domain-containing protein